MKYPQVKVAKGTFHLSSTRDAVLGSACRQMRELDIDTLEIGEFIHQFYLASDLESLLKEWFTVE